MLGLYAFFSVAVVCIGNRPVTHDAGSFGSWTSDRWGLPMFNFTLDQDGATGTRIASNYSSHSHADVLGWAPRSPTDALFQLGNDRLVVLASVYGYLQMRQDEGAPKLLNDFDPDHHQYGGGLGYLFNEHGDMLASTWFQSDLGHNVVERVFGIGHRRITVVDKLRRVKLSQTATVPFGEEPLLVSSAVVSNLANVSVKLHYVEVWGAQQLQLPNLVDNVTGVLLTDPRGLRYEYMAKHYTSAFEVVKRKNSTRGISMSTFAHSASQDTPSLWDRSPPTVFLSALDVNAKEKIVVACDAADFFRIGGAKSPSGNLSCPPGLSQQGAALILDREVTLGPRSSRTLYNAYGYLRGGQQVLSMVQKYSEKSELKGLAGKTANSWKQACGSVQVSDREAVGREAMWHCGSLRQSMTFYDYLNEFVLDQGEEYRYIVGFEGAARDPLQHLLPLIYSAPERARSILRGTLEELMPPETWGPPHPSGPFDPNVDAFNLPYALTGGGVIAKGLVKKGLNLNGASDFEIYLLLAASMYILGTKDVSFLSEVIPFRYKLNRNTTASRTVLECLCDSYTYLTNHTGVGEHGLMRVQTGDWNDGFADMAGCGSNSTCLKDVFLRGESVLNSALVAYVLPMFAEVIEMTRDHDTVQSSHCPSDDDVRSFGRTQKKALHKTWNGKWFNRAWIPGVGWIGGQNGSKPGINLEPQPWAVLSGIATHEAAVVLESLKTLSSPLGTCQLQGYCAVWPALSYPVVMAHASFNMSSTAAWDEWLSLSLATQAKHFPTFWPGIWSSSDHVDLFGTCRGCSGSAGFPVLNLHRHAWPLFTLAHSLVGIRFCRDGVIVSPALPAAEGAFTYQSTLASLQRDHLGRLSGMYMPLEDGPCDLLFPNNLCPASANQTHGDMIFMRIGGNAWTNNIHVAEHASGLARASLPRTQNLCGPSYGALEWTIGECTSAINAMWI